MVYLKFFSGKKMKNKVSKLIWAIEVVNITLALSKWWSWFFSRSSWRTITHWPMILPAQSTKSLDTKELKLYTPIV